MKRFLFVVTALAALSASAQQVPSFTAGTGRISLMGGWRYTPNDYFIDRAAEQQVLVRPSNGGPQALGTFAYAATDGIEVAIDLFAAYDAHDVTGHQALNTITYGALLGARLFWALGAWTPNVGLGIGPSLVYVNGMDEDTAERVVTAYAACAGLTWRLNERMALTFDARWLIARGYVPAVGAGINAGGPSASVGFTWIFPPEPDRAGAIR